MPLTTLLGGLFLILGSSAATEGDPTCKNGDDCMYDTLKQDLSALFQSKNAQILTASVPANDAPVVTSDQMKVFVRPASQKLAEMNATMTALKALSAATPEVNIVVQGMIDSINTNIKPHIITDHTDTQTLVDTTISTLSTRTTDAVEKKKDADAADNTLVQCYAEQRRLLVDHENGKIEEARLKGEMDNTCSVVALKPKTYAFPPELKKDLTCDFSVGDCTDVRDIRKAEHDKWLNALPVAKDKKSYDDAHAACEAAKLAHENQVASCKTMWSNFVSKNEHCLYALKAQQLAICMFGDSLHYKCETKSDYDTLIRDIDGVTNSDSTSDRAKEWEAVNKLECMLDAFIGGAIFDNAMIAKCTKNETDAKADFELKVGIIDKKTEEYTWLISEANFTCLETAITFSGDKWSVPPQGDLTNHVSSAYTMVTGYEYAFESDVNKAPFDFCVPRSAHATCGDFDCGSESPKPADTKCYVEGGCTTTACCVKVPVCGDHVLDAGEDCDDGNTEADDECPAACVYEADCTAIDPSGFDGQEDFNFHGGASWNTRSGDIRSGNQNSKTSVTQSAVTIPAGTVSLRFQWIYIIGYCRNIYGGQGGGTAPMVRLEIDGQEKWSSSIDLTQGDYYWDTECGENAKTRSPVHEETVAVSGLSGAHSLVWNFEVVERNIHFDIVSMHLCSQA